MKSGIKFFLFILTCVNLPLTLIGQQHQEPDLIVLDGVLMSDDSLKPISDAKVFSRENFRGTFTDSKGRFTIAVVLGDTLLFSSMGYSDRVVAVNDSLLSLKTPIPFFIKMDTVQINEVVIHALWNYRMFKQKIIDMKPLTHPLDLFNDLNKHPIQQKPYDVGIHILSPIQTLYNLYNAKAVLQRRLLRNRKKYNKHMIKLGKTQDIIPADPDYMRKNHH